MQKDFLKFNDGHLRFLYENPVSSSAAQQVALSAQEAVRRRVLLAVM